MLGSGFNGGDWRILYFFGLLDRGAQVTLMPESPGTMMGKQIMLSGFRSKATTTGRTLVQSWLRVDPFGTLYLLLLWIPLMNALLV